MLNFLDIYKQMRMNSIALFFKGYVTFELVDSIIMIVSSRLEHLESNVSVRKRVYGVLTECLQNLCTHVENTSEETPEADYDLHSAVIMVDSDSVGYFIKTGNFIRNNKIGELKEAIEEINTLSKEQLKEKYNKILSNKTFSEKGGAGLGLVDIARKSGEKLEYQFEKIDEKFSFFSFQTTISKNG
ncbi:MAG: SiaB family protein kinase [Cytophagales bacterium]